MNKNSKIYVAGHSGMVGAAIVRKLETEGYINIVKRTSKELDLRNQAKVSEFFMTERPEYVVLAAAKVGGIMANINSSSSFLLDNLMIECNVIKSAHDCNVKKLLFLGSSCIYPKEAKQPLKEEYLLAGPLEPTNEGYAIAKIVGIKLCEYYCREYGDNFISIMPSNIYGPGDNFDLKTSHVMAALIRRIHEAKINKDDKVTVWGTGQQYREFMYIDDLAEAAVYLFEKYSETDFINVGTGEDIKIRDLAYKIKDIVGYGGEIVFDTSKPDGMKRKVLEVKRLEQFGWKYKTKLEDGIIKTYRWYTDNNTKRQEI